MKSQNPLRISQESLNLDDIISDLNDTNTQSLAAKITSSGTKLPSTSLA